MKRALIYRLIPAFYGILFVFISRGQEDSSRILRPVPILHQSDSILKITDIESAVPLYNLDKIKLAELGVVDVGSVLKYIPGVQLKDYGGAGGIKTVSFRSLGAAHTGVVLDGHSVPNAQSGAVNLSSFELFGVESIQFSSGQSVATDHTATSFISANLISVHSQLMEQGEKVNVSLYSNLTSISMYEHGVLLKIPLLKKKGSFGVQSLIRHGNGSYAYTYPKLGHSDPLERKNAELMNYRFRSAFIYKWSKSKVEISGSYNDNDQNLPGAVILYNPQNDQKLWNKDLRLAGNYSHYLNDWTLRLNSFYQSNYTRYLDPSFLNAQGFIDNDYLQQNSGGGLMISRKFTNSKDQAFIGSDLILSNLTGNNINAKPERYQSNSVIGFGRWLFNERIRLESNLSFQFVLDQFKENDTVKSLNYYKPSPFVALSLLPFDKESLRIRGFYKRIFRMPAFNDLYYNFIGNTGLKPEEANLFDLGMTYGKQFKNTTLKLTLDAYTNKVWNKIVAIPTKDLFIWSMQNIGITKIQGMDVSLMISVKLRDFLVTLNTSHNMNESVDITAEENPSYGHQIPYTPQYSSTHSLSLSRKGFGVVTNMIYTGSRYSLNENITANYLDPFIDWNAGISKIWKFKSGHEIYMKIQANNLLNKNYEVIRSFPMPGRHYQLTLKYNLL